MIPKRHLVWDEIQHDPDFKKVKIYEASYLAQVVACLRVLRHEKVEIVVAVPENMFTIIFKSDIVDQNTVDAFRELFVTKRIYFKEQVIHGMLKPKYKEVFEIAYRNVYISGKWY